MPSAAPTRGRFLYRWLTRPVSRCSRIEVMGVTADIEREVLAGVPTGALINGQWVDTGKTLSVEDPSTGETLVEIADCGADEALEALTAAANAQASWGQSAPRERGEILRGVFEQMNERIDDLALIMTLE